MSEPESVTTKIRKEAEELGIKLPVMTGGYNDCTMMDAHCRPIATFASDDLASLLAKAINRGDA